MSECDPGTELREFEDAVLTHLKSLYYTAYHLTRNRANAEDLTQETYLKAFCSYRTFRKGTNALAWLTRIMLNSFINDYHRSKREVNWEYDGEWHENWKDTKTFREPSFSLNEHEILGDWIDDEVKAGLDHLPIKYRSAVIMFDLQGHSYQEIAETFNCAIGTVKSRLFRGRNILKHVLRNYAKKRGWGDGDNSGQELPSSISGTKH